MTTDAQLALFLRRLANANEGIPGAIAAHRAKMLHTAADGIAALKPLADEADRLRTALRVSKEKIAKVARAIGRTANDLDEGCDEPCDTDGGICICIELHWDQALAALRAAGCLEDGE